MQPEQGWGAEAGKPGPGAAIALALLTAAALGLRLAGLGREGFWFDETYTHWIARLPLAEAWRAIVADGVHPPLYYAVARGALLLGRSEAALRLPSALFGALTVPLLFAIGSRWIDRTTGWIAAALLAVSPFHLWHSRDARMYAMLAFLGACAMMAYTAWLERRRAWTGIALAVSSALAYLTHYFALFLPLVQFLHLAIHLHTHPRALRRWVGIQLAAAVPFAVWVLALLRREGQFFGIGWIPTPRLSDLLGTLVNFIVGYTGEPRWWQVAAVLVGLALAALGIGRAWRVRQAKSSTLLWAAAPALIAFALSMRRPVYMDRFLILSLPAVLLLIASGVRALPRRLKRPGALAVLGATAIAAASFFRPAPTREQWREAAARLEGAGRHEAIIVRVLQIVVPLSYYYEGSPPLRALEVNREVASLSALAAGHEGTWLVYWNASADIHRPAASPAFRPEDENDPEAAAWLSGRGPSLVERFDYVGVTVLHFGAQP